MTSVEKGRYLSPDDHGVLIVLACAVGLTWTVLVFCIRLFIRIRMVPPLGLDDATAALGVFVSAAQVSTMINAVHHGLGRKEIELGDSQKDRIFKATFAASLLYIPAIAASKCSTSLLIARLTRTPRHLIAAHTVTAFTTLWAFSSLFVIGIPAWDTYEGFRYHSGNLYHRWVVVESFSMAIEVIIFSLSIYLVWSLSMSFRTKFVVANAFCCRLFTHIPTLFRLKLLSAWLSSPANSTTPKDYTYTAVQPEILTQVVMHFSLMAATLPCIRQFLRALDTDLGGTVNLSASASGGERRPSHVRSRSSRGGHGGSGSYALQSASSAGDKSVLVTTNDERDMYFPPLNGHHRPRQRSNAQPASSEPWPADGVGSASSPVDQGPVAGPRGVSSSEHEALSDDASSERAMMIPGVV